MQLSVISRVKLHFIFPQNGHLQIFLYNINCFKLIYDETDFEWKHIMVLQY